MTQGLVSVRSYAVVTAAYWAFTLTDGALRMLVLLHFHELGYSPLALATLFLAYEVLGAATNLFGGALASRIGLKVTLLWGLSLQVGALVMLSALSVDWSTGTQVAYVLAAQGLSGVAKDLTKLSAKSAIKAVVPAGEPGALFKWVALLTGSKNTLKGVGFFLGAALLSRIGFAAALHTMAGALGLAAALSALALPRNLGQAKRKSRLSQIFAKNAAVNTLSAARVFLFGARDVWFVVALPVFLTERLAWTFSEVGGFMAAWVVGYGAVQVLAPRLMGRRRPLPWGVALAASAFAVAIGLQTVASLTLVVLTGLGVFGALFAVNSSLHSYLIVAHADADQTAADVGFYYMANAIGRLVGTVLSGLIYQLSGLTACLIAAGTMVIISAVLARNVGDP